MESSIESLFDFLPYPNLIFKQRIFLYSRNDSFLMLCRMSECLNGIPSHYDEINKSGYAMNKIPIKTQQQGDFYSGMYRGRLDF